jgi:acyl carrier protein
LLDILEDVCPGVDFEHEQALIDDGLLESLDIVSIVTGLMDEFDVEINVDDLLPENFNTLDAIAALVEQKQS